MNEHVENGHRLFEAGDLAAAASSFEEALALDPANPGALHSLGVVRDRVGDHRLAADLISRAIALRPSSPHFLVNLAEAHRKLGDLARAENSCQIALRLDPEFPEGLNTLGLVLHRQGRRDEAIEQFRKAVALRPDMASAHNNLGLVLQESGRHEEAIASFRLAVGLSPELNRARTNLGLALVGIGRAEEALEHFQEAALRQPQTAAVRHNLGNALRVLGRYVEARAAYLDALLLDPRLSLTHHHVGLTLRREGRPAEAIPWHRMATDLDPSSVLFWRHLAESYREVEDPESSVPCWERILALAPPSPEMQRDAHVGLGSALQDVGRHSEAMEHYRAALSLCPDSAPAHFHVGVIHEEFGDMSDAETSFREALRLQPDFAPASSRLATLLRADLPDADFRAMEEKAEDGKAAPLHRAHLLFGLSHVHDARGDYPRAADCLRQANALALMVNKEAREYSPTDHNIFVSKIVESFNEFFFERVRGAGLETLRPVFVFGLPRSGTTLIEQILASHPRVHGAGELRLTRRAFDVLTRQDGRGVPPFESIRRVDPTAIRHVAEQHLGKLDLLDGGRADRIVDKMPDNYQFLGLLAALFPNGTFVHCRRDLRDVSVSCWMTDFRSIRWANHPEHIASRFTEYRRLMGHWRSVLPVEVHDLDYEEAVNDLEGVARRLLAACRLDWDPRCLEFYAARRPVRTASVVQVRRPLYKTSVSRWKNYELELSDLFALLPPPTATAHGSGEPPGRDGAEVAGSDQADSGHLRVLGPVLPPVPPWEAPLPGLAPAATSGPPLFASDPYGEVPASPAPFRESQGAHPNSPSQGGQP